MKAPRGSGRLFLPTWRPKEGGPRRASSRWWWELPDGHGGKLRGSTGVSGGAPGRPPREALEVLWQKRAELGQGRLVAGGLTVDRMVEAAVAEAEAYGVQSAHLYRARAVHLKAFFAGVKARDVVEERDPRRTVAAYVTHRRAQAEVSTINLELGLLRRASKRAVRLAQLHAPIHAPRLKGDHVRQGFIEDGALEALLDRMPEHRAAVARLLKLTGWREREALCLTWADVDWQRGVLRLDVGRTKTRAGREFPFGDYPALLELLEGQREKARAAELQLGRIIPTVFFEPDGSAISVGAFYGSWRSAREKLGVRWLVHDLRRTWARGALLAGLDPLTAMALGGWQSISMLKRYAIMDAVPLRAGVAKLAAAASAAPSPSGKLFAFDAR